MILIFEPIKIFNFFGNAFNNSTSSIKKEGQKMKFAIMESIVGAGGHEIEHDRVIIEELKALGHEVELYVPKGYHCAYDYNVPINYLPGKGVSYVGVSGLRKTWRSLKREFNRLRWYKGIYQQALLGRFDAIIFPTATYRFFRSLNHSPLRQSPVPLIFCVLGVTPPEGPKFFREVEKLVDFKNIKIVVMSLFDHVLGRKLPNVFCVKPAVYAPEGLSFKSQVRKANKLKIGFFGQYRKEKRMEDFLEAFTKCKFERDLELVVQTVAIKPEDRTALEIIRTKYSDHPHISFFDKAVYGKEWQEVISEMDALIIPYAAPRFRFHGSGMLLTALGQYKPVVIADEVWHELLNEYQIGVTYKTGDKEALTKALETFVNTYDANIEKYLNELKRISEDLSPSRFVAEFVRLAGGK